MSPSGSTAVARATNRETREHNERLVLATIYDHSPISRAAVARLTGLTRTSVSDLVEGLLASGMCREMGRGPSTGGKAPILLEVPGEARLLVGVDLGDEEFTAAIVNLRGSILRRVEVPSANTGSDEAVRLAVDVIERVIGLAGGPVLGVGIGAPGLIDAEAGTIIQSVDRDWRMVALGRVLEERLELPVYLANDCQAAVLAEHVFGTARGPNLIMVKAGRGIGAGFVINGEPFLGDGYGAGEIGHTIVDPRGRMCRCGRRGCLETLASVPAVLDELSNRTGQPVSLEEALEWHQHGDPIALEVVRQAGERLGSALGGLVGALHIRRFVLAGAMAAFGAPWLEAVASAASSRALSALAADTTFELGGVEDVVVLGASALLMTRELGLTLHPSRLALRPPRLRTTGAGRVSQAVRRDLAEVVS
jgi:predicted NBD/HSP70 family sugar kinase